MKEPVVSITLDLQKASTDTVVSLKQGNTVGKIAISLSEEGFPYEIAEDCYAVLTATKPDGTILYNHCQTDGNTIYYEITEQTTAVAGRIRAEVKLYGKEDQLVTTASFCMVVHETVCADGAVESFHEVSALTHLISQSLEIGQRSEELLALADTAKEAADEASTLAEEASGRIEDAVRNANAAADRADQFPLVAQEAKQKSEEAIQRVNTLREVVSKFHSNIQKTEKGEVITVDDASDLPLAGLKVFGKTEQRTTTGKNLLKTNINTVYTGNGNNVRIFDSVEIDGGFQSNLQYTFSLTFSTNNVVTSATGNLIYFESVYTDGTTLYNGIDGSITSGILTFSSVSGKTLQKVMVYTAGRFTSGSVEITNAQIEKGSTATAYEPYTGGKPSPSPEYPQELESVGESVNVTVCGKNLLDVSKFTNQIYSAEGVLTNSTNHKLFDYIPVKKGDVFTLSAAYKGITAEYLRWALFDVNKLFISRYGGASKADTATVNISQDGYIRVFIAHVEYDVNTLQLEAGSAATDYEPYTATTATVTPKDSSGKSLYLPGIPVESGGNYTDSKGKQWICDEVDFEKGVYVQRVEQILLDGSEEWMDNGLDSTGTIRMLYMRPHVKLEKHDITLNDIRLLSDCFTGGTRSSGVYKAIIEAYNYLNVTIRAEDFVSIDDWVTSLAKSPIELMFVLAEENPIPLSAEQLAAFAALHSNYPITTVFNDQNAGMEVKYVADTKLYIDKKFNELAAALVNRT